MSLNHSAAPSASTLLGETSNTRFYLVEDDIILVCPHPGVKDDGDSARENVAFQMSYAAQAGRKLGFVVVLTSLMSQDADARRAYATGMLPEHAYGAALVVSHPLSRAIASFFMGLSKPRIPTRIVESIDEGIASLRAQRTRDLALVDGSEGLPPIS